MLGDVRHTAACRPNLQLQQHGRLGHRCQHVQHNDLFVR